MTELPEGARRVVARAQAAGLDVRITPGSAAVACKVREYLFTEDGAPLTTDRGRQRFRQVDGERAVTSIGVRVTAPGQGQFGAWVGKGFAWALAWPADRSDIPRAVGAGQLGTLINLDALREQAIARARTELET